VFPRGGSVEEGEVLHRQTLGGRRSSRDNRGFVRVIASYQLDLPGLLLLSLGLGISLAEVWIGVNLPLLRAQRVRLSLWGTLLLQVG
jgi:hypothetical protein